MSFRNPFKHGNKKNVIPSTLERGFERDVRKLEQLEDSSRAINRDVKKCIDAQAARAKSECRLAQDLQNSAVYKDSDDLRNLVDSWCMATRKLEMLTEELNATELKVVAEPSKKFSVIFPSVQLAVRKREQSLQEYVRCQEKRDKYSSRERTGPNVVKLENSRKALAAAKTEFDHQTSLLSEELPRLYESRIDYFQPSVQAVINAQIKYYTDAHDTYRELCKQVDSSRNRTDEELNRSIQAKLADIRALSITTTEDQI